MTTPLLVALIAIGVPVGTLALAILIGSFIGFSAGDE